MINFGIVINTVGVFLAILGLFMLIPFGFSLFVGCEDIFSIGYSSLITLIIGIVTWLLSRNSNNRLEKREGFLIVVFGWIAVSIFSSLPYLLSGVIPDISNSVFESVSGLTTTGATVIDDIESVPRGILLWRSLTQWIGGMGIIVLTIAIFPLLGIGGVELFVAEVPGPTSDKIHPRIKETAKMLWFIYLGLTVTLTMLLFSRNMNFFDSLNHALTTMATGGFSTKNLSIAHFDDVYVHYIITLFMFIAGTNYTLIYFGLKGSFKRVWKSEEFKSYVSIILLLVFIITLVLFNISDYNLEKSIRIAIFQVISIISTTGFVITDYTNWTSSLTLLFFILFFVGGCAGSTSGGIKIIRHLVFYKNSFLELKRLLHPKGLIRIKIDKKIVAPRILTHVLVFLLFYLMIFLIGSVIMTVILSDFDEPILSSIGAVATSLGNIGPAISELGPMNNFSSIPFVGKWILTFIMLLGRLEIFTVLILFSPSFWRSN